MGDKQREVTPAITVTDRGIVPTNTKDIVTLARAAVSGGFAPKGMSMNQAICAIGFGLELGLRPFQALQGIAVINGRPCLWGDTVRGLIMGADLMRRAPEETISGEGDNRTATCRIWRRGFDGCFEGRYSIGDAKRAGLYSKDPWQKYADRMLKWRAFHYAARDAFPDVLKGVVPAEVLEDTVPDGYKPSGEPSTYTMVNDEPLDIREVTMDPLDEVANSVPQPQEPEEPEEPATNTVGTNDLWKDWLYLAAQLSDAQLEQVKTQADVKYINKTLPPDALDRLIAIADQLVGGGK